jgi:hypothetical protein
MEALPSLALRPPPCSCSNFILRPTHYPSNVSLSLGCKSEALHNILCYGCAILFSQCGMAHHKKHYHVF